jgi:D-arabinose 1-dehydrogenase-like Zn-dependent alcohol dehydrogenase
LQCLFSLLLLLSCRHEIVGIVTEVGPEVTKFKPGDRAGVGTYVGSCRNCAMCKEGEDIFCPKMVFTYNGEDEHGMITQGGYSTHTVVDEQ